MDELLLEKLYEINTEEKSVLEDSYNLYNDAKPAFANMPLKRKDYIWNVIGTRQMITLKPHIRFVDIPIHSHSYIEMVYVCKGSLTHFIDGHTIILDTGNLLLLNRHAKHSISAAGKNDIAINFIISNDFLKFSGIKFRNSKPLSDFAENNTDEFGKSKYLIFNIGNFFSIENLIENMIVSALFEKNVPQIILTDTLSLIFRYLEMYPETLIRSTSESAREESEKTIVTDYIETNYSSASLSELSELLEMTPQYVSRLIKKLFGASFSELVKEKRFSETEKLLINSNLSIIEISEAIGYENNSFFHKRFKEQYGTTPAKWKKAIQNHN